MMMMLALALGTALAVGPERSAKPEAAVPSSVARGARLFDGTEPLAGTLSGHSAPLPDAATRCIQCHAGPGKSTAAVSGFAPLLDRRQLREILPRRGGPPVAYERTSFCRTLRTGIDPAHVTLPRAMPRFDADEDQCAALWDYLTQALSQ
ncbi:mono/diheme cytochrome c family protein [Variovorax paradoxus]|uniref:Mono/diheme cytochrome c family protein n=1 Tax=Variovorax paradoxus TaxID=34073 RepID=A0AAW8E8R2_VARPD|nr:hypothetical protein [Variovorax paradoxus]MDP9969147.1 mono/diheme cytochrome c family protein [Variovorax paradoxus]